MATKDFRASQVETSKIIGSGSISGTTAGIAIYSGSVASNREGGTSDPNMFQNVGSDVFLFVSGTISNSDNTKTNASLFGGDVVISGTLYAERQVIEVDSVADGDFYVTGSMFVKPDVDSTTTVSFQDVDGNSIFNIDSTNNRVGIGDTTPDALLDIQGASTTGAPSLRVDHDDTDQVAVQIEAANIDADVIDVIADAVTTAKVVDISADALTTGNAINVDDNSSNTGTRNTVNIVQNHADAINATALSVQSDGGKIGVSVDKNYSNTSAATIKGISVDLDKTGASSSGNTVIGVDVDVTNTSATAGTNNITGLRSVATGVHASDAGNVNVKGIITHVIGGTNGNSLSRGIDLTVDSASPSDTNEGIYLNVVNGGTDIKAISSANENDFFSIATTANGATTISTVDQSHALANLTMNVDGALDIDSAGAVTIDSSGGAISVGADNVAQNINIGTHDSAGRTIDIGSNAATVQITSKGGTLLLDGTGQLVDVNSAALDIDASGAITIDGTSTFSVDAVGTSNLTTNGALTLSGSTGLNLAAHSGEIDITATQGNIDINATAGTLDIDSAGALTIDSATSIAIGTNVDKPVSIDSTSFTLDASTTVAIDGTGISIDGIDDSNITVTGTALVPKDLDISVVGGNTQELRLSSAGTGASAIQLNATAGGVNIDAAGAIGITSTSTDTTINSTGARVILSGSSGSDSVLVQSDMEILGSLHGASPLKINDDIALTGSARFKEQSAPVAGPNEAVLYAKDVSGVSKLFTRQSDGLEVGPLGSGGALDDSYDTPIGGGTKAPGAGAIITADNQPVQIKVAGASSIGLAVTGSVIFGSGSTGLGSSGLPPMPGTDTHFFVSGSHGGRGTFGTSVFGGDLVVSGDTRLHGNVLMGGQTDQTTTLFFDGSGAANGPWIRGNTQLLQLDGDKNLEFRFSEQFKLRGEAGTLNIVRIIEPTLAANPLKEPSSDALQIFSGSIGSRGTTTRGTAVFGGDTVISGTLAKVDSIDGLTVVELGNSGVIMSPNRTIQFGDPGESIKGDGTDLFISSSRKAYIVAASDAIHLDSEDGKTKFEKETTEYFRINRSSGDVQFQPKESNKDLIFLEDGGNEIARFDSSVEGFAIATNKKITFDGTSSQTEFISGDGTNIQIGSSNRVLVLSGGASSSPNERLYKDVNFFVSGSKQSREKAPADFDGGTALFGGDVVISGSLYKSVTTYNCFQSATPTGNPTNEFHFEWSSGTVSSDDPESSNANDFWMFFPKGGRLLDVTARGGATDNSNDSNPFSQRLVIAMYQWGDTWINSSDNVAHGGYTAIGHVTSSIPADDFANEGGTRSHKAVWNMDYKYFRNNATGSFEIPAGSSVSLAFKGIDTAGALTKTHFFVTIERDL